MRHSPLCIQTNTMAPWLQDLCFPNWKCLYQSSLLECKLRVNVTFQLVCAPGGILDSKCTYDIQSFHSITVRESALNHFRCFLRHSTWGSPIEESLKDQTANILCCSETTALPPNASESHFRSHFTPSSLKSCIIFKAPTLREIKRWEKKGETSSFKWGIWSLPRERVRDI